MDDVDDAGPADQPGEPGAAGDSGATLAALVLDLTELRDYLEDRGRHTYELAQRFLQNARRGGSESAYDERQATMLEYQHYIWHEIAGRVDQLLARHAASEDDAASEGDAAAATDGPAGAAGAHGSDDYTNADRRA